jgi:hypothetical protein
VKKKAVNQSCEEAVGLKNNPAKDQWAGIEALKRTRIALGNLPLLRFF